MGTAVFSAVSLKLCCWGPLLLTSVVGISGSSVYFSWLIALKPYLLARAFLSLGLAFYQVYKKKRVDDCDNCETDKPSFFKSKFYLWLVTGYFGVMTPPFSVKLRHFEKSYNYKKILGLYTL